MSDTEENQEQETPFHADRAAQGKAACRKCKQKCQKGELRIAKLAPNMFGAGLMKQWHHLDCMFDAFLKQRITTRRIDGPHDIGNWENLSADDQNDILKRLEQSEKDLAQKYGDKYVRKPNSPSKPVKQISDKTHSETEQVVCETSNSGVDFSNHADNTFREFRRLCTDIANVSSYTEKTGLVREMFTKGRDGGGFKGNIAQWCRLLLPSCHKKIYNLQSKQLVKLFSRIFAVDADEMFEHLEQGDISDTIQHFFVNNKKVAPASKSLLKMQQIEEFLGLLSGLTKEDEQIYNLKKFTKQCTPNDLKTIIRLIKHDLRINAGAKHILEGVHPDAYPAFQSSHDLNAVIARVVGDSSSSNGKSAVSVSPKGVKAKISLMTSVLPMLAEPCKTINQAMKKCPNGMYSEIKYDGERVQVHKKGSEFKYFSRSLKPVVAHKVNHFKDYIPLAFPHGKDLILDSEILMIDTQTSKPLPFGTLGVHKQSEFQGANVCLFVFDCIYYNGEDLTQKPLKERKRILNENMTEIKNHIMFSELEEIRKPEDLAAMIASVLKQGLEGLVLKDLCSVYEPGKRHWLKVKKDYLFDGAMADSADLVVLGAWFGTGKKGGMMSVFLMGCYDPVSRKWCTVTKVHTGHDDATLERLQTELKMIKISCDPYKVPDWLRASKTMVPDFVAKNPKDQPVWEITGAEFTQHDVHTADGISVRFPRVTRIRDDKNWETHTSLPELKALFETSKQKLDDTLLRKLGEYMENSEIDINKPQNNISPKKRTSKSPLVPSPKKRFKTEEIKQKVSSKTKISNKTFKKSPIKLLPDIFTGVKISLYEDLPKFPEDLLRYFIAYGGEILPTDKRSESTHILHKNNYVANLFSDWSSSALHVTQKWLTNSIAASKPINPLPYLVILNAGRVDVH